MQKFYFFERFCSLFEVTAFLLFLRSLIAFLISHQFRWSTNKPANKPKKPMTMKMLKKNNREKMISTTITIKAIVPAQISSSIISSRKIAIIPNMKRRKAMLPMHSIVSGLMVGNKSCCKLYLKKTGNFIFYKVYVYLFSIYILYKMSSIF